VKNHALFLVGAELRTILHRENKNNQQKKGTVIILPSIGEGDRIGEDGTRLYSPNWVQGVKHADNRDFIEALISAVCVEPVSFSLISVA
jgi:hypothetical protein